jgi:hypothetical protein
MLRTTLDDERRATQAPPRTRREAAALRGVPEANAPISYRCHSKTRATKVAGIDARPGFFPGFH